MPPLRSLLFVPGDRPDRMAKALASEADALILDLEDAVAPAAKPFAREVCAAFLAEAERGRMIFFVRINPLDSGLAEADLAAILPARPDGIMLPKSESAASVAALARMLDGHGASPETAILPIVTETPAAVFGCGTYADSGARLVAMTWGAEDLPAAMGSTARTGDGAYTPVLETVRALALLGAHAAGVAAIETVYPAIDDPEGLAAYAARGRRDGFTGMLAIHPAQVPIINAAFSPSPAEIARAQAIVALFGRNPDKGALAFEGRMVDAPHLKAARALLARADGG
ncbi:HpcH/HpaI aldolase/citrate lyase family protein [Sphingomonas bacterium]|uniref:HpcH/HpaI aldolase/citrate lyase family protein n=1 Tax=Sphingomonas bacterium TaxID=1895847 RepID=UPI003F68B81B